MTNYLFAHLPHPEGLEWHEHPFKATFTLTGLPVLIETMLGQQHHSMHHFLPHVPWFKYHRVWNLANGVFKEQAIPEKKVFARPDLHFKDKVINSPDKNDGKATTMVKISDVSTIAKGTKRFTFKPVNDNPLPSFQAGAHINIHLPSGKIRSYSLVNPSYETNKYQIAVKLDANGKGGSKEMHEEIQIGAQLKISHPKNNFVLYQNVQKYILISGGIGITPLISMAHKLTELDKHFEFHICARSESYIPFRYEFQNWTFAPNTEMHFDKDGNSSIDLTKVLAKPNSDTLIYICGPRVFSNWIKESAYKMGWKKDQIKEEIFTRNLSSYSEPKSFELVLNKSGKTLRVEKDLSIIDTLLLNNIKVEYTCLQGTCGACITNVIDGDIDHRDAVLSEEEKLAGNKISLCVSRAKLDKLVIDI